MAKRDGAGAEYDRMGFLLPWSLFLESVLSLSYLLNIYSTGLKRNTVKNQNDNYVAKKKSVLRFNCMLGFVLTEFVQFLGIINIIVRIIILT